MRPVVQSLHRLRTLNTAYCNQLTDAVFHDVSHFCPHLVSALVVPLSSAVLIVLLFFLLPTRAVPLADSLVGPSSSVRDLPPFFLVDF
jgi:hypothetical protein